MNVIDSSSIKRHLLSALNRYWSENQELIEQLPVKQLQFRNVYQHMELVSIRLPDWAKDAGVKSCILVPAEATVEGESWQNVDWWLAAFLMLECWHERHWERENGCIHSFSYKLKQWDTRAWDYAWVNRIGLFLRTWAAKIHGKDSPLLFGELPKANIVITHDVDAIKKTLAIRLKQSGFHLYNALRLTIKSDFPGALNKLKAFFKFALSNEDWWTLEWLIEREKKEGIKAHFNFYADTRTKSLKRWLMDPSYSLDSDKMQRLFQAILQANATIGLHPTYDAWDSSKLLIEQKFHLEKQSGWEVTSCRQHWLRFSWDKTWSAQSSAGIKQDTTLMFNDRPGFRASAALSWLPWAAETEHTINELPTVLMDSQFYDYQTMTQSERKASMQHWIDEVKTVGGDIAVLWHSHTLTKDYDWFVGFETLLEMLKDT